MRRFSISDLIHYYGPTTMLSMLLRETVLINEDDFNYGHFFRTQAPKLAPVPARQNRIFTSDGKQLLAPGRA